MWHEGECCIGLLVDKPNKTGLGSSIRENIEVVPTVEKMV